MTIDAEDTVERVSERHRWDRDAPALPRQYRAIVDAFTEAAVLSAQSSDLDGILHLVARRLCELLSVQRCSIFLRDVDGRLHGEVLHACGIDIDDEVKGLSAPLDHDAFTRELFGTNQIVLVDDPPLDAATTTSRSLPWTVHRGLGVPLLFDGPPWAPGTPRLRAIGVVYIHILDDDLPFSRLDIEVARTFSRLASFAIRHAWMTRRSKKRADLIERQRTTLVQLNQAHVTLTEGFVSGTDLEGLIERLVELLRKPVTVYDEAFRVIEWGTPGDLALTPGLPAQTLRSTWFARQVTDLLPERASLMIPPFPPVGLMSRRLICPLRVDGSRAGYLEVTELGQQISSTDVKIAEHGATVISLQLLTERRANLAEEQAQAELLADFLDDLLRGAPNHAFLGRRAQQYGIDLDNEHVIVRLGRDTDDDAGAYGSDLRKQVGRVLADRTGWGCRATSGAPDADLYLLGPLPDDGSVDLPAARQAIEDTLRELGGDLGIRFGAISRPCRSITDYAVADREVAESVRFAAATGRDVAVTLQPEHGLLKVLLDGPDSTASERFARESLEPLLRHDRSNDGELLGTVRAYLMHDAKIRPTAEALGVHENTIRYRLTKLQTVCSVDPDCLDDLLDLRLAIQLFDAGAAGRSARPPEQDHRAGVSAFDENRRRVLALGKQEPSTDAMMTA